MDIKSIGQNIRDQREHLGLTLSVAAKRAAITASALSKIEKGQTSSPISTLISIAEALRVPLSSLFEEKIRRPDFVVTRKNKGIQVERDGTKFGYSYEALAAEMTGKPVEPFILVSEPGTTQGMFQHGGEEFIFILSGKVEMTIGENLIFLEAGDSVYFNPRLKHSGKVIGDKPARMLCLFIQDQKSIQTNG